MFFHVPKAVLGDKAIQRFQQPQWLQFQLEETYCFFYILLCILINTTTSIIIYTVVLLLSSCF